MLVSRHADLPSATAHVSRKGESSRVSSEGASLPRDEVDFKATRGANRIFVLVGKYTHHSLVSFPCFIVSSLCIVVSFSVSIKHENCKPGSYSNFIAGRSNHTSLKAISTSQAIFSPKTGFLSFSVKNIKKGSMRRDVHPSSPPPPAPASWLQQQLLLCSTHLADMEAVLYSEWLIHQAFPQESLKEDIWLGLLLLLPSGRLAGAVCLELFHLFVALRSHWNGDAGDV